MPAHGQNASLIIFALFEQPLHFVIHLHSSAFNRRVGDREVKVVFGVPDFRTVGVKHKSDLPI